MSDDSQGDERLIVGDSRRLSVLFPALLESNEKLKLTITSPPYWRLKDYGRTDQIGWKQDYASYLDDCEAIFQQIFDASTHDATMWVISDTLVDQRSVPRRLVQLPSDLANRAEAAGWTLRDVYIWKKDKTLPYSGPGRLRNSFEYIHFFVKSEVYAFNVDRLRDPVNLSPWWVQYPERYNPLGKVPTNVWDLPIPMQGTWSSGIVQHACPLPPDLVRRIVLLCSEPGDTVFDPFAGTGTVLAEAMRLGRRAVGVELNASYVEAYRHSLLSTVLNRESIDAAGGTEHAGSEKLSEVIQKLRAVKYPKVLGQAFKRRTGTPLDIRFAHVQVDDAEPGQRVDAHILFISESNKDARDALQQQLVSLQAERPMSRFQVDARVEVVSLKQFLRAVQEDELSLYEHGRTWNAERSIGLADLSSLLASSNVGRYFPITSNVVLKETAHRTYA